VLNTISAQEKSENKNIISTDIARYTQLIGKQNMLFDIFYYRVSKSEKNIYRTALKYYQSSDIDKVTDIKLSVGLAHIFKKQNQWEFTFGTDAIAGYEQDNTGKRYTRKGGAQLFFGARYRRNDNFSFAVEPAFRMMYNDYTNMGLAENQKKQWFELDFNNLGMILVSFHF
jgi:hypothetical protein